MRLFTLLLIFAPQIHCFFSDILGNIISNEDGSYVYNNDPRIYLPYINSTINPGFAGLFTISRMFEYLGTGGSLTNLGNCIGTLVKTWDTPTINATALNWNAVGLLSGNCFGDFAGNGSYYNPTFFSGYTSGAFMNEQIFGMNGPLVEVSFNIFVDVPASQTFNSTINAIHFGSQQFYDLLVVEFSMTNAQALGNLTNLVFYDPVASNNDILQAGIVAVTSHIPNNVLDVFPRVNNNGIFTGFGTYYLSGESSYEAIHYLNANLIVPGPLFTADAYGNPVKLIGFGLASQPSSNYASKLVGVKACFVGGVFRIELPFCLPQYKMRLINSVIPGYIPSDFNTTNFNQTIKNVMALRPDMDIFGFANAQAQLFTVLGTMNDLVIDTPSVLWPDMPEPKFV